MYIHKFPFNNVLSLSTMVADLIAVQKNKQALRRERNKVEVLEGKFRSLKVFLSQKRKQTFTCHTSNQNCHTCVRVMF